MKKDPTSPMNMQPVLLYGPLGTGKSYLATYCAVEMQAPAFEIKCQDTLSSKLGESEKLIAQQFDPAASSEPKAVVIINEFESLCRRNKSSESAEWMFAIHKCFIDIFDNLRNPAHEYFGVKVLLTTNLVDEVDAGVVDCVEKVEMPLPSEVKIAQLLPALCAKHVPGLDVRKVDWKHAATLEHHRLSIRGLKDALEKGYRQLLELHGSPVATTELIYTWMRQQIGKITPEAVKQPENFKCVKLTQMVEGERIFSLDEVKKDAMLILRKTSTGELFTGIGCYATLKDGSSSDFGFQNYHVYVQCKPEDASREVCVRTMSVLVKSYGQTGVRRFNWEYDPKFENLGPPTTAMSIESSLAPLVKRFVSERIYIETRSTYFLFNLKNADVFKKVIIYTGDFSKCVTGEEAKLLVGNAFSPKSMNELGYRVFLMTQTTKQLISCDADVLHASHCDDANALTKVEVEVGQIIMCEQSGSTVADAPRRDGIHYTALQGVFVRRVQQPGTTSSTTELYTVPTTPGTQGAIWTGDVLADFEKLSSFRAKYVLFSPCTSARQVLGQGVRVMVDTHKINESSTPERPLAIALLRLYPEEANGRMIRDPGFEDEDKATRSFQRGWYRGDKYWRALGSGAADTCLSAGTVGNPREMRFAKTTTSGATTRESVWTSRATGPASAVE